MAAPSVWGLWGRLAGYLVLEVGLGAELPLLEHLAQLVQATVVEVQHLVLALSAGHDQLATGAGLVTEGTWGGDRKPDEYANAGLHFRV